MKKRILIFSVSIILSFMSGCERKITKIITPENPNDALHGDIVGKVVQKDSNAKVYVSQIAPIDSAEIDPEDGSFEFTYLRIGNYDLTIRADNYRIYTLSNVMVQGGGVTYLGEIDLSTVPDLVAAHYPPDKSEVVYSNRFSRLSISIMFTRPMDRESVEKAFSTDPPSEGVFYWGLYSKAPRRVYFVDWTKETSGFEEGATITTYSKITSFTYSMARKDCFVDTTYYVTLSTEARDTSGNQLRFPLEFSFKTVQASYTIYGIQTQPVHGDVDVDLLSTSGIQITFPRRMDPVSTELAISMTPDVERIYIWPSGNKLTIYTGGPFLADTTYYITIDSSAKDLDGVSLGETFSFYFSTAPVSIKYTSPRNGELYVNPSTDIIMYFNTYMIKSTVQNAFSIDPYVSGTFKVGTVNSDYPRNAITFMPGTNLSFNTKYTVTIEKTAQDLYGSNLKKGYSFAFIIRPD